MPIYKRKRQLKPYRRAVRQKKSSALALTQRPVRLTPALKGTGFPSQLRTKLRYCDVITLTSTASVGTYTFRMNSLFDPDFTSIGHQPYYYDQLAALYNRYAVQGSTLKATFSLVVNSTSTIQPSGPVVVGVKLDDDGSLVTTDRTTLQEENDSITEFLGNGSGGHNMTTITVNYNPKRDLGILATNDALVSVTSANPTRPWFANLFMFEEGASTTAICKVKVEMIFDVIFSELKDIVGS